jgi:hypothetical protein
MAVVGYILLGGRGIHPYYDDRISYFLINRLYIFVIETYNLIVSPKSIL